MEATIEQIPRSGQVEFTLQVTAKVHYSAEAARRLVGRFAANEISYLLRSSEPSLVMSEHIVWRVPVLFALPSWGSVGSVGHIDVDVQTGELTITPELIQKIQANATEKATYYSTLARPAV
ncbi:MAG: hypothetical protein OT477_14555 [Chloroflexi bacterium]|nr:hypothetical protein [Chloroflexota bacterium]